ncbi:hypothetical protein IJS77_04135 [bacterium]|nr:hypothetical protein [bacterium]
MKYDVNIGHFNNAQKNNLNKSNVNNPITKSFEQTEKTEELLSKTANNALINNFAGQKRVNFKGSSGDETEKPVIKTKEELSVLLNNYKDLTKDEKSYLECIITSHGIDKLNVNFLDALLSTKDTNNERLLDIANLSDLLHCHYNNITTAQIECLKSALNTVDSNNEHRFKDSVSFMWLNGVNNNNKNLVLKLLKAENIGLFELSCIIEHITNPSQEEIVELLIERGDKYFTPLINTNEIKGDIFEHFLSKMSAGQKEKYNKLLNDAQLQKADKYKYDMIELAKSENTESLAKLIKRYPENAGEMLNFTDTNKKLMPYVERYYNPDKYVISSNQNSLSIADKKNGSLFFIKTGNNDTFSINVYSKKQNGEITGRIIVNTPDGTLVSDKAVSPNSEKFGMDEINIMNKTFKKLKTKLDIFDINTVEEIANKDNIDGEILYKTDLILDSGHAELTLPQGKTVISKKDNTEIMRLYNAAKSNTEPERTVSHYLDGKVVSKDLGTDTISVLEPNKSGIGMNQKIVQKMSDGKSVEVNLSSEIQNDMIKIINNRTGKSFEYPILKIIDKGDMNEFVKTFSRINTLDISERKKLIPKLLKKCAPTTILNLINFAETFSSAQFPYIKDYIKGHSLASEKVEDKVITLTDSPYVVSHEALHSVTEMYKFIDKLKDIHSKEAKNNIGFINYFSEYATIGKRNNFEDGLDEFLSIFGTMNEYGVEFPRGDVIRLAFPKTAKKAAEIHIKHYQNLINKYIENK